MLSGVNGTPWNGMWSTRAEVVPWHSTATEDGDGDKIIYQRIAKPLNYSRLTSAGYFDERLLISIGMGKKTVVRFKSGLNRNSADNERYLQILSAGGYL